MIGRARYRHALPAVGDLHGGVNALKYRVGGGSLKARGANVAGARPSLEVEPRPECPAFKRLLCSR